MHVKSGNKFSADQQQRTPVSQLHNAAELRASGAGNSTSDSTSAFRVLRERVCTSVGTRRRTWLRIKPPEGWSVYTAITPDADELLNRSLHCSRRGHITAARARCSTCMRPAAVLPPARANGSGRRNLHQATLLSCHLGEHYCNDDRLSERLFSNARSHRPCSVGVISFSSSVSKW
ncbi:hypothetical protein DOTSEDRAFT_69614 [Dothistroma septosporum NZE10]|uniref:Uncharacterized protein n=1 Tax=Dothistroma septosporum (strain NZE10 / CBS 128990) TaxID=675120 RepID=N1PW48_DOTSN|nr:hypothetical protein DOTSEDRAFT_69614 [Dothistroma septosporum NZE10]